MICATRGAIAAPRSRQLLGQPRPASEHIVERQRELVTDRPQDLGLEERAAGDERTEQVALGAEGDDAWRLRAVARDEPIRHLRAELADRRDRHELGGDAGQGIGVGGADEPSLGGVARARLGGRATEDAVDDVAGHDPVGRVLAAADAHDAVRLDGHPVLARRLDGRAVGRARRAAGDPRTCRPRRRGSGSRPSSR